MANNRLRDFILSIPHEVRDVLLRQHTHTTLGYLYKRLYEHPDDATLPTFKLKIALGLDKASRGKLDFRDMIEDADQIDWSYLRAALNRRGKAERLTKSSKEG